eukprot:TRINITY_DN17842_c0_g2_i2.p1 TRINITY_DN17842_c0_g2~~TRINITY_DN17842_c0_g2_i2.p1  ORF type:complete len:1219 (+),score=232.07 TRINITY_DN17842_c0_g2_i2:69-3725(+)
MAAPTGTWDGHATCSGSPLQRHRSRIVPPLPRVLGDLVRARPYFEEVTATGGPLDPLELTTVGTRNGACNLASAHPLRLRAPGVSPSRSTASGSSSVAPEVSTSAGGGYPSSIASLGPSGGGRSRFLSESHAGSASRAVPSTASTDIGVSYEGASSRGVPSVREPEQARIGALRIGIVFCGERQNRPAHPVNVVAGVHAYLSSVAPGTHLIGFEDGPPGFLAGRSVEISGAGVMAKLNMTADIIETIGYGTCSDGGFSEADRAEEAQRAQAVCDEERLDGLIFIAGPRDLSWAASISASFARAGSRVSVVGVPHSKNLNLYVPHFMPITLGFDTAARTVSEVAGNIAVDALSSKKYWHFVRCGHDALTMEVALQTRCTFSVLNGERRRRANDNVLEGISLADTVARLRGVVERRRAGGRYSGLVLLGSELIKTLPEMQQLKLDLLEVLDSSDEPSRGKPPTLFQVEQKLTRASSKDLFKRMPRAVQMSLVNRRDKDGLPLLPRDLESHRILGRFLQQELRDAKCKSPFAPRFHVMELVSNAPLQSPFDCAFGYLLGHTAAALVCEKRNFYVASCADMHLPVADWAPCAVPFSFLCPASASREGGQSPEKPSCQQLAIPKTGSTLRRNVAEVYMHFRDIWVECNAFKAPGPVQFGDGTDVGPITNRCFTLLAEYLSLDELKSMIQPVQQLPRPLVISTKPLVVREQRVRSNLSELEKQRLQYQPGLPSYLRGPVHALEDGITPQVCSSYRDVAHAFPLTHPQAIAFRLERDCAESAVRAPRHPQRVGVVFASHQCPGFHSVVHGLFECIASWGCHTEVVGFLGGYEGLIKNHAVIVDREMVDNYRNLGGQDMLCQFGDPPSLAWKEHLAGVQATVTAQRLHGLVVVGALEAMVDAALINEALAADRCETTVVGVPISLDSNIPFVQHTIGFHTGCRTLTAYLGNLGALARSSGLWVFVRVAGDAGSHVAAESALRAHPNLVLLARSTFCSDDKEAASSGQCLSHIVARICDLIVARQESGLNYGVVSLPLGYVTEIVEMRLLFAEISEVMSRGDYETSWDSIPNIAAKLKPNSAALFDLIPRDVQHEICFGGRTRGTNRIDCSSIETDRLLLRFVEVEMERRWQLGAIKDNSFRGACYPMVYQARSAIPTDFDCDLAYTLGWAAALTVRLDKSGRLVHASRLERPIEEWQLRCLPLSSVVQCELDVDAWQPLAMNHSSF